MDLSQYNSTMERIYHRIVHFQLDFHAILSIILRSTEKIQCQGINGIILKY